MYSYLRKCRC